MKTVDSCGYGPYYNSDFRPETTVTLQVGLIGKDGFVLASDRKNTGMFGDSSTTKMFISSDGSTVCAVSGTHVLSTVGKKMLRENANKAVVEWDTVAEHYMPPVAQKSLLSGRLIFANPRWERFQEVSFWNGTITSRSLNPVFGGDEPNLACYFSHAYYSLDASVDELCILAAHVILEGALVNPTAIGDLDLVVSKDGEKPHFLNDAQITSLKSRSTILRGYIGTELSRLRE